ncbi:hypothetical protein D3C84_569830 [compost metagenome]
MDFQPPDPERFGSCLKCHSLVEESEQSGGICFECHAVDAGKEPAFPVGANEYGGHGTCFGLSVRDYFAANVQLFFDDYSVTYAAGVVGRDMPDYAASPLENAKFWGEFRARMRFIEADAMLAARTK